MWTSWGYGEPYEHTVRRSVARGEIRCALDDHRRTRNGRCRNDRCHPLWMDLKATGPSAQALGPALLFQKSWLVDLLELEVDRSASYLQNVLIYLRQLLVAGHIVIHGRRE